MYEMWLNSIPVEAAAEPVVSRESPELRFEIDGRESPELPWEREYRAKIRALEDELTAMRREQSSIQRSFFEAAQIQRRLCAPRQFHSTEFEVAGEIFPVRHLSGDFFKVFELGAALGIIVGDIAGKGLSAGIWMPHLISLVHSCARAHSDPGDAIAAANRELCL